jgi:hypothetical protein
MAFLNKRPYLNTLVLCGFVLAGCGGDPKGEVTVENVDTPPQVTITLHSQLELDYDLEPSPQLQTADLPDNVDNGKIDRIYAQLKGRRKSGVPSGHLSESRADTAYQSIKRYEKIDPQRYVISIKKGPERPQTRKTVDVQDKPLVFAGRGYNISAFEREIKPAIDVDYSTHLVVTPPDPLATEIEDRLDIKAGYSKDTKNLVYNSTRSALFGKSLPSFIDNKSEPAVENQPKALRYAESAIPLERNPDSILIFPQGEESLLVLRKAEKQYDLLVGNESLNKKQYRATPAKVPETSNKTPSNRQ